MDVGFGDLPFSGRDLPTLNFKSAAFLKLAKEATAEFDGLCQLARQFLDAMLLLVESHCAVHGGKHSGFARRWIKLGIWAKVERDLASRLGSGSPDKGIRQQFGQRAGLLVVMPAVAALFGLGFWIGDERFGSLTILRLLRGRERLSIYLESLINLSVRSLNDKLDEALS